MPVLEGRHHGRFDGVGAAGHAAAVLAAYLLLGLASYAIARSPSLGIAATWPPSGVALAALLRAPRGRWPLLLAAVFVADWAVLAWVGTPVAARSLFVLADVVDPLVGAALVRRALPTCGLPLLRVREVFLFAVFGVIVGPIAGCGIATLGGLLTHGPAQALRFVTTWWGSAALGAICLAPLVLTASMPRRAPSAGRAIETALLVAALALTTILGFSLDDPLVRLLALATATFPLLAWAAIRFGPPGAAWVAAGISTVAVVLTARGHGPFVSTRVLPLHVSVAIVQAFFALASSSALLLAATTEERRRALRVHEMLADAGAILASMAPLAERLERALRRAADTLCSAAVLWRAERPFAPLALAQRPGDPPLPGIVLAELVSAPPAAGTAQRCDDARCWLQVPVEGAGASLLALRATHRRRYFDPAEVSAAEALGGRVALELERERLLRDTERLYRDAQDAVHVRDQFLSIASHELKTPLTPMSVRLQLLRRRAAAGLPIDEASIERVQVSLGRLAWLINDLLDVSRIQAGTLALHRKPTSLPELVERAVAALPPDQASRARVRAPHGDVQVFGDAARLEQVIANLLDNAMKYSTDEVTIEVRPEDGSAHLLVRDRGIGIPREQKDQLFERFYRARNASAASYGGLGLGLYIVRDIVERHGGRVWAENNDGAGATFHVALPLASAPARLPVEGPHSADALH